MRIRKNARLVLGGSSASCSPSFLVCQLNRSPWDVDSFSPQGEWDDTFALNGSLLGDSILPSDSIPSGESMELSFEYVEKPPQPQVAKRGRDYEIPAPPELELELEEAITTPLCSRVDGKGWHCQLPAKRGHTLCDHHFSQLQHNRNKTPKKSTTVEVPSLPPAPKRRGRPKKPTAPPPPPPPPPPAATPVGNYSNGINNSNNPYEFYYYSGFGPSWRRRRGGAKTNGNSIAKDTYQCDDSGGGGGGTPGSSSTMSEDEINDNDNHNNVDNYSSFNSKKKKDSDVVIETVVDEELDYIDDDDDDEDDDQFGGRQRVRKPIKARSLKSLM